MRFSNDRLAGAGVLRTCLRCRNEFDAGARHPTPHADPRLRLCPECAANRSACVVTGDAHVFGMLGICVDCGETEPKPTGTEGA